MNNLGAAFHELVSLDAWRTAYNDEGIASVHVDLSFLDASIEDPTEKKVTFLLRLKCARLKVVVPRSEPLAVVQSSVDREPSLEGIKRVIELRKTQSALSGTAAANLGSKSAGALEAHASASRGNERSETIEKSTKISQFKTQQLRDANRNYLWVIEDSSGSTLSGKVWDPVKNPRLSVKQAVKEPKIEAECRVVVSCRKCDFDITDVKVKKDGVFALVTNKNKLAAAHALIKRKLVEHGLVGDYDEDLDLVEVTLAAMTVPQETQ